MIAAAAAVLSLTAAVAGPWAVVPLEGVNVHDGHTAAARQVLKDHLASLGQATFPLDAGVADPGAAAREKGAVAVLRGTLTRLGQKVKVNLTLAPIDGPPRSAALDAGSPEDLDPVLMRLARNLVSGEPLADPRTSEVTQTEADALNRRTANSYFGISITGMFAQSGGTSGFLSGPSAYWLYDLRTFFADIQAGLGFDQTGNGGNWQALTVALLYPLIDRDLTPFIGGGVGYGQITLDGLEGSGLQLFADAGAIWGRSSSVHFRADVKPYLTTFELREEFFGSPSERRGGKVAWGLQAALGVGF
jgi:hypothetical protein